MCDPITIGAMALQAVGGAVNGMQNRDYVDEVNNQNKRAYEMSRAARMAEIERQKAFEAQATGAWEKNLQALAPAARTENQDNAVAKFLAGYDADPRAASANTEGQYLPGQTGDDETRRFAAAEAVRKMGDARNRAAALAKLGGYNSGDVAANLSIAGTNDALALTNGLRRGSLGVSQQEQSIGPAKVTKGFPLGDIIAGVGSIAGGMGGSGFQSSPQGSYSGTIYG